MLAAWLVLSCAMSLDVLVVDDDPGAGVDFETVQAAVDVAVDGDVILVRPGVYGSVTIDALSVSILADPAGDTLFTDTITVRHIGSNQSVLLRGLDVADPFLSDPRRVGIHLHDNVGSVWVEDCRVQPLGFNPSWIPAIRVERSQSVALLNSEFIGRDGGHAAPGEEGLNTHDSSVTAYDCDFTGGDGGFFPGSHPLGPGSPGGDGAWVEGGVLFASGCRFEGGRGANGAQGLGPCQDGGEGGDGLRLSGTGPVVRSLDCTFEGGDGGWPPSGCFIGPAGLPVAVEAGTHLAFPGNARSFAIDAPVRESGDLTLTIGGEAGDTAFVVLALQPGPNVLFPEASGTLLLQPSLSFFFLGSVPTTGPLQVIVSVPELGPGILIAAARLQLLARDGVGQDWLGPAATLVLLDSSP